MFDHFIWSVVVCPVLVAVAVWLLADRMRPDTSVIFSVSSIAVTAAACVINLAAFAVKALAELPFVAGPLGFSAERVRADTAYVPWVSWVSVVLLTGVFAGLVLVWRQHRRDAVFARRYAALPTEDGLALIDDDRADAFAVPGRPGRIVVTTGMRAALDDDQYAALLAHERAHLAAGHHRLVQFARLSAAAYPVFWWLARRMEYLVERAADERAADELGSRRVVATAIGKAALVSAGATGRAALLMAPSSSDLRHAGVVPRRVASLIAPRRGGSILLLLVPVAVAASSVIWTGECVYDLGELLTTAGLG
jgi:Zn-dependent protease with chaperone function